MADCEYFCVGYRGDQDLRRGPFTYSDEDLVNAEDGNEIDLFVPDPSLRKARAVVRHRRKNVPDIVFFTCATWFLISQKAWEVVSSHRFCESIRWVPTAVCRKDGTWIADYHLAYGAMQHDIWDYARADFYWQPGMTPGTKEAAGYMKRGVVNEKALPRDYDFFRATHQEWVASRRLRDAVMREPLAGFEFRKICEYL
jgi:hypothetical protein